MSSIGSVNTTADSINALSQDRGNLRENLFSSIGTGSYDAVLEKTQEHISGNIIGDISKMDEEKLKDTILKYITDHTLTCSLTNSPEELTNYLYHDMAKYSFITREKLFEIEDFEELDINGWNDIDIIVAGKRSKTDYSFLNPIQATDIISKMLGITGQILDDATPSVVTDLGKSIRIAALKSPVVDKEVGVSASIRKVSGSTITKERLLENSALTEKMLNLLDLFIKHGASVCFSGETGSGKTTLAGFLLNDAAEKIRTFTIEEGSREWDFRRYDENGKVINSVVHFKTRPDEDKSRNIDQNKGLQIALRFNPTIIGVGEMRSDEAYSAAEASTTGHTVVTTVHASSAHDAPLRIVGLCKKAYDFSDTTLMTLVANAFPIHVYQEFLPDGSRRVTEIIEVVGCEDGKIQSKTLVEYKVEDNIIDPITGDIKSIGEFVWVNPISAGLHQKLLKKGATRKQLSEYMELDSKTV